MGILGRRGDEPSVRGPFVTPDRLDAIDDAIPDRQSVLFLARGSTVDVVGTDGIGGDDGRHRDRRGYVWMVTARQRVGIVPERAPTDATWLPYEAVEAVELATDASPPWLTVATDDAAYRVGAELPGRDELLAMTGYIDGKARFAGRDEAFGAEDAVAALTVLTEAGVLDDETYDSLRSTAIDER